MTIDIEKLAREAGAEPDNDFAGYWLAHPNHLRDLCESYHRQKLEGVGVEPVAVAHMHRNGEVCTDRMPTAKLWPVDLYPESTVAALQERIKVLEAALLQGARDVEALKRECGMEPESPVAIQNSRYMSVAYKLREALKESSNG